VTPFLKPAFRRRILEIRQQNEQTVDRHTIDDVLYAGTRPLRLSLREPPLGATPVQLWRAFEAAEADKVKGSGGQQLANLVNLVRHALMPSFTLVPYREELHERYQAWLKERDAEHRFTVEQREWLDRMAEHIAPSLAIEPGDFETGWFGQHGSRGAGACAVRRAATAADGGIE
jgi:hypothetical protein